MTTQTQAPDLTTYLILHRGMRTDAARLAAAVAAVREPERAQRAAALSRWYAGYRHELHEHHTVEDEIFFPALVERLPVFDSQLDRIEAEHSRLEELLQRTDAMLAGLGDPEVDWPRAAADATDTAAELSALMRMHLDFEDADVVPLFARRFGLEEYEDLEERARKGASLSVLKFTLPWIMEAATPAEQQGLLGSAPLAFKLLWLTTRRRYARMAKEAFGPALPAWAFSAAA